MGTHGLYERISWTSCVGSCLEYDLPTWKIFEDLNAVASFCWPVGMCFNQLGVKHIDLTTAVLNQKMLMTGTKSDQ